MKSFEIVYNIFVSNKFNAAYPEQYYLVTQDAISGDRWHKPAFDICK